MNPKPLLLCDGNSKDHVSMTLGFRPYRTVLEEGVTHAQPVVWLSNDFLQAQQHCELEHTLRKLAAVPRNSVLMQGHGIHYLVMGYSLANALQRLQDVQEKFQQFSWKATTVFTTVKPEVSRPHPPTAASAVNTNSPLPYMLVVFEVGTPPAESTDLGSQDSNTNLPLEDSHVVAATSRQESTPKPSPSRKRPGEHSAPAGAGKRLATQASTQAAASAVNQQPLEAAVATSGLGDEAPLLGHLAGAHLWASQACRHLAQGQASCSWSLLKGSAAQAAATEPGPHRAHQHAQLASGATASGPPDEQFTIPPGSPQA